MCWRRPAASIAFWASLGGSGGAVAAMKEESEKGEREVDESFHEADNITRKSSSFTRVL